MFVLVTITVKDYASTPNALVGDRPLDNPGYSAFQLKGGVDRNAQDILDITRVEQRLKYLGYAATNSVSGKPEQEIKVGDGKFDDNEQKALKLFETVVRYTSAIGTGRDSNNIVEIQYRATVTGSGVNNKTVELKEVPGSFKRLSTSSPTQAQIEAARAAARQNALRAAGYQSETDLNGIDGKIEADANSAQRKTTLDWLNAYNTPHWLQFFASLDSGYQTTNARLGPNSWTNQQTGGAQGSNVFGTSWVFDLMVVGSKAATAQNRTNPLLFNGAGTWGTQLNLGINPAYISPDNQTKVNSKDIVVGRVPATPASNIGNETAYTNKQWDYGNATALAGLLLNPNVAQVTPETNSSGLNKQDQAFLDFAAVFSATQTETGADNSNGSLEEQLGYIYSATTESQRKEIQNALFGDGTQTGGVINSDYLQLGGSAKNFGSQMTTDSLRTVMGNNANVAYAAWVEPLQKAMAEFEINTPQRIAAFFSQIRNEGNLQSKPESFKYSTAAGLYRFKSAWSYTFAHDHYNSLPPVDRVKAQEVLDPDPYNDDTLAPGQTAAQKREQNATLFYDQVIRPALALNGGHWSDAIQALIANRVYSSDHGNGFERGTGLESSGEGWKYRGHGQLQLTGKTIIQQFAKYVSEHYQDIGQTAEQGAQTAQRIMDDPTVLDTDPSLSARSAAWLWGVNKNINAKADNLDESDSSEPQITGTPNNPIYTPGNLYTDTITKRIATDIKSFRDRWKNWRDNVDDVYTGGNPYESMRDVLNRIGIQSVNAQGYESQFGITLRKRTPVDIGGSNHALMTESIKNESAVPTDRVLVESMQALLTEAKNTLGFNEGEYTMLIADMPDIPPSMPTVVMMAQATSNQQTVAEHEYVLGICELLNLNHDDQVDASPVVNANAYFAVAANDYPKPHTAKINYVTAKVKVLQQPKHGYLEPTMQDGDWRDTRYIPNVGYLGHDFFELQVEGDGYTVKLDYFVAVTDDDGVDWNKDCPAGTWKISTAPNADPAVIGLDSTIANLTDGVYSLSLPAAFADIDYASPAVTFANLTGAAVGETKGEGANAAITLDTDAAGHGWYIDYTPYLNDGFLPTSNPNEWVAKAGSSTAGKMDMLSVLLHEYGHALGLEHSADAHDFMGATLTPGTRRLPTADELTLMAQLVAEAKQNLAGLDDTALSANCTNPTPSPIPSLPLGAGFGISFLGLTRRNNNSAGSLFGEGAAANANAPAQYDTAANPTLVNGDLNSLDGWEIIGNVAVNSSTGSGQAGGAAVFSETTSSQTRLNQVFVLGEHDRFLSFTLANAALGDQASGPDDAFEAALLDANTGLSLLGATGLTRNDAFLNLQANGEEHHASGITRIDNADGSRTYLVDLGGIAAGTVVNLSFDLIGFGQGSEASNSRITVRDLRLGVPQTAGDSATLAEDTPTVIDALANDINALQPGFIPVIVNAPSHGQVTINPSNPDLGQLGSFSYTPDKDWYGEDSFSYKLSDSHVDSNLATVTLTVTPVNDAPVANAITSTLLEDGRITLNLLDSASDVDGDPLSVSVGNPQHGQLLKNADGSYTYVPQADYNGEDSFSYSVSDSQLDSGQALVRLTISAVNDAPVAQDDSATLDEDHSIHLSIMANDYDVDGDSLNLIVVSQPVYGTLVLNADNTVSYTPIENWSGEDSFSYQLNDGELDSGIATVRLIVNPVADAPTLVLSEVGGASRELFRTGWESVGNRNTNSTLLNQRELEGWTFVARPGKSHGDHDDHDDHHEHDSHEDHGSFKIWSTGDKMRDAQSQRRIVSAANGNGSWLELNNAKGEGHETLGIERTIETIADASYTLSLDLAGHLGYGTDSTRIGIYLDGVKIGSDESTSPSTALNWQSRVFQFIGLGGAQTIRIVSEASQRESNGRGMMIDNIALTETLQANTGFEDGAVPLSAIGVALRDTDGSEILTLTIGAIPVGATLSDGTHSFTATLDHAVADVTGWNLNKLTILPPQDFNGQFVLKLVATSTEQANRSQASSEADLLVTVLAVNDAPLAAGASYTLSEGGSVIIDFAGLISDIDGDVLTLNFSNPKQGTLTKNVDGTYTYTPKREFSGTETFTYTVSDGKLSTTASIILTVLPKKDYDEDHRDNGWHHGFEHSEHHGYQGYDDERCTKIIVQSVLTDYGQQNDDRQDAMVNNQQSNRPADKIDWAGQAPILGKLKKDNWVTDMMTVQPKEQSLAELTGLVVKMK